MRWHRNYAAYSGEQLGFPDRLPPATASPVRRTDAAARTGSHEAVWSGGVTCKTRHTVHDEPYVVHPIGIVRSSLREIADAPNQAFEGAPLGQLEPLSEAFIPHVGVETDELQAAQAWPFRAFGELEAAVGSVHDEDVEVGGVLVWTRGVNGEARAVGEHVIFVHDPAPRSTRPPGVRCEVV